MKNLYRQFITLITSLLFSIPAFSQEIWPGGTPGTGGSYNLTFPPGPYPAVCCGGGAANINTHYPPVGGSMGTIYRAATYTGPVQTNDWWTPVLISPNNPRSELMHPHPLLVRCDAEGQTIGFKETSVNGLPLHSDNGSAEIDLRIGLAGMNVAEVRVADYGDWHVKMEYDMGGGNVMHTTAGHGFPYVYFTRSGNLNITLYYQGSPIVVRTKSTSGNSMTVTTAPTGVDRTFGLFFPPGTQMGPDGFVPVTGIGTGAIPKAGNLHELILPAGVNYFSVAALPDWSVATLDLFENHAFSFITSTQHSYSYNESTATLTTTFNAVTTQMNGGANQGPLQALYRHQWLHCPQMSTAANTGLVYPSTPRGAMHIIRGNVFTTEMINHGVLPALGWANTADSITLYNYINDFGNLPDYFPALQDIYGSGIAMLKLIKVAEVAHQVGHYTARDKLLDAAKAKLQSWLRAPAGDNYEMFHYNPDWNYLVGFPTAFQASDEIQDSHFHLGYFIKAAAGIAQFEVKRGNGNNWAQQWGPMIELLIRNISEWNKAQPPAGPWFPYLRHFDPYAGHSWASNGGSARGNNQESVSEALNYASAVLLWGQTVGNTAIRDLGVLLYVTESEAARQYWWDTDNASTNRAPFDPTYQPRHAATIYGGGASYATFFSADPEHIHGITYIPISGGSLWMGTNVQAAADNYAEMIARNGGPPTTDWSGPLIQQLALSNAEAALDFFYNNLLPRPDQGINPYIPFNSEQVSDTYHWIHTLDSVGTVDASTTANIATYAVFEKEDCKHYMIYNPPLGGAKTVNFSDGRSFDIPDDTLIVLKWCDNPLPVTLLDFNAKRSGSNTVSLTWSTSSEINNNYFVIERSEDGKNFYAIEIVKGAGNSTSLKNYFAWDNNAPLQQLYYRLKQTDYNGNFTYSKIVSVSGDGAAFVNIYPNPAGNELYLRYDALHATEISINILDILGREIMTDKKYFIKEGNNEIKINISDMNSGSYILMITNTDNTNLVTLKFLKQ